MKAPFEQASAWAHPIRTSAKSDVPPRRSILPVGVLVTLCYVDQDVAKARTLAVGRLSECMPRRWSHVAAVAERAEEVAPFLDVDKTLLVSAAWLHDIGYAPSVVMTGFHPLDGARYLRTLGYPDRLVSLVAHHSRALLEAEIRGLDGELLDEFPHEESVTTDALWFCDMTTGPDGEHVPVRERLAEIRTRYGPGDVVTLFIDRAEADLVAAVRRTEERLQGVDPPLYPM